MTALIPDSHRLGEWRDRLPIVVEVALWSLLAVQAVRLVLLFVGTAPPAPDAVATDVVATSAADAGPVRIPAVDLFYRQERAVGGPAAVRGYRLFGLRSGPDGASAILGKDGKQASYAVGEALAPGIALEAVGVDHVWLRVNGQRHRLTLPPIPQGPRASAARALPVGAVPERAQPAAGQAPANPPAVASAPATPSAAAATNAAGISAGQLLDASGLAGAAGGVAAKLPGGRDALLRLAGLRADDVVLSVEGRPLDPARLSALGRELAGRERVTIQYRRDGRIHTATLDTPR